MEKSMFFIGICPPHRLETEIHTIKTEFYQKYGIKGAFRSKAHITLQMPFNLAISKEERFLSELIRMMKFEKAFELQLNNYGFFEPRVVFIDVMDNLELDELQSSIEKFMKQFQVFNSTHKQNGFNPHITVAFRDLKKPTFYKIQETVKDRSFQASFLAKSITVFKHNGASWETYKEIEFGIQ